MAEYTSQQVVYNTNLVSNVLSFIATGLGVVDFVAINVHLLKTNVLALSSTTTIAELTANEANYTSYVVQPCTFTDPANLTSSLNGIVANVIFACTGAQDPANTIYGYWLADETGIIYAAEYFAGNQSFNMGSNGDFISITVQLPQQSIQACS